MSNEFRGTGNIADAPTLKTISVNGEDRKVAELRVFFDDYKPDEQGGFTQSGGFWLDVSVWGDARAEGVEVFAFPDRAKPPAAQLLGDRAQYLRQADMGAMRSDLEGVIRRYPTQSLAVGLALGFLLARAFR